MVYHRRRGAGRRHARRLWRSSGAAAGTNQCGALDKAMVARQWRRTGSAAHRQTRSGAGDGPIDAGTPRAAGSGARRGAAKSNVADASALTNLGYSSAQAARRSGPR